MVRGGYGIFDDVIQMNILNDTRANFPYALFPNITYTNPYVVDPTVSIQESFAPGAALPPPSFKAIDQNLRIPYSQHASLAVEHQFGAPILVSIGGTWLHNVGFFSQHEPGCTLGQWYAPLGASRQTLAAVGRLTYLSNQQYGHYYALEAKLQTRQWHGAMLITAFTWGKSLDDTSAGDASVGAPGDAGIPGPPRYRRVFWPVRRRFREKVNAELGLQPANTFQIIQFPSRGRRLGRMGMVRRTNSAIRIPHHAVSVHRQQRIPARL